MKICVLLGGASPERMVSLSSGVAIGKALSENGHEVLYYDPATALSQMEAFRNSLSSIEMNNTDFKGMAGLRDDHFTAQVLQLKKENVNIVFNALHGGNGENGAIAAMLELAGIPFTGSGFAASALAMDKYKTKLVAAAVNVQSAECELHDRPVSRPERIAFPLVLKPNDAGSSVGLSVFHEACDLTAACREALVFSDSLIIERYIPGREFNIPVIAGEAFPVLEVDAGGVYDFTAKYLGHKTQYLCPAPLSETLTREMQQQALRVWKALGLRNYARIDFRMTPDEEIFLLEANTLPGMTASSLVPKSAKARGLDFSALLELIIRDALTH
ncbi:MAG: D-alanine--D-alanine ligase [Candidatus Neomarinimicrobiota bacterium]|jgi:D-alanine-D-alanine ligase